MSQPTSLTINQKKYLRGIAHGLNPMLIIGAKGLSESVLAELESTLSHHEILKIKLASGEREDRKQMIDEILKQTGALLVQSVGKICVIYRQNEETQLPLPK
jgi:RNA-binding protein